MICTSHRHVILAMRLARHVARMKERKRHRRFSSGNQFQRDHLEDLSIDGTISLIMILKTELDMVDWIGLVYDRNKWW